MSMLKSFLNFYNRLDDGDKVMFLILITLLMIYIIGLMVGI